MLVILLRVLLLSNSDKLFGKGGVGGQNILTYSAFRCKFPYLLQMLRYGLGISTLDGACKCIYRTLFCHAPRISQKKGRLSLCCRRFGKAAFDKQGGAHICQCDNLVADHNCGCMVEGFAVGRNGNYGVSHFAEQCF